jgi:hypothetical protein
VLRKALEMGISLDGEPGRGFIYQGLTCRRRIWRWVSLFIVASLGNLGGGVSIYWNFEI